MKNQATLTKLAISTVLLAGSTAASAAFVTFSNINDSDPGGFGAALIAGNSLQIDVSGFNATAVGTDDDIDLNPIFDTLSFKVTAPTGMFIESFNYHEHLKAINVIGPGGIAKIKATGSLVLNGDSFSLGTFSLSGATFLGGTPFVLGNENSILLPGSVTELTVSITNSILAVALGDGTTANVAKGQFGDEVFSVNLAPIPLPPAAWMLGSALVGLVAVGRRKLGV